MALPIQCGTRVSKLRGLSRAESKVLVAEQEPDVSVHHPEPLVPLVGAGARRSPPRCGWVDHLNAWMPPARLVNGTKVMPWRVPGRRWMRGSPVCGAATRSSSGTSCARASGSSSCNLADGAQRLTHAHHTLDRRPSRSFGRAPGRVPGGSARPRGWRLDPDRSFVITKDDTTASISSAHRDACQDSRRGPWQALVSRTSSPAVDPGRCGPCACRCCASSPSTAATPTSCVSRSLPRGPADRPGRRRRLQRTTIRCQPRDGYRAALVAEPDEPRRPGGTALTLVIRR